MEAGVMTEDISNAPVDDLTNHYCLWCGTPHNLVREPSLYLNGEFYGPIFCERCGAKQVEKK